MSDFQINEDSSSPQEIRDTLLRLIELMAQSVVDALKKDLNDQGKDINPGSCEHPVER